MTPLQKIISFISALSIFIIIIGLVRSKKIMEEYSIIWLFMGVIILIISLWEDGLRLITHITGIIAPSSIVFFFGIMALILMNLQITIKLSKSREELKNIIQKEAITRNRIVALEKKISVLIKKKK